jgi:hypothetical protein
VSAVNTAVTNISNSLADPFPPTATTTKKRDTSNSSETLSDRKDSDQKEAADQTDGSTTGSVHTSTDKKKEPKRDRSDSAPRKHANRK